jgi:hypothetical protein
VRVGPNTCVGIYVKLKAWMPDATLKGWKEFIRRERNTCVACYSELLVAVGKAMRTWMIEDLEGR